MQLTKLIAQHPLQDNYRLLRVYAWYRLLLAIALIVMQFQSLDVNLFGRKAPALYLNSVGVYALLTVVTVIMVYLRRSAPATWQIVCVCLTDIIVALLISHASGGIHTGLALLLLVPVAAANIFLQGSVATMVAALAVIGVLVHAFFNGYPSGNSDTTAVPMLGILLFITSLLFQYLTRKIRYTSRAVQEQTAHALTLQRLNAMIVQRMNTGVVALDKEANVWLYNDAAAKLLDWPAVTAGSLQPLLFLQQPKLVDALLSWRAMPQRRLAPIAINHDSPEVQLSFAPMAEDDLLLVFVEDSRQLSKLAQDIKLASLGHLTASIAHEIRNPIGAISHAAQLLSESEMLDEFDRRFAAIIQTQSLRVNKIIENTMQLSRRAMPAPERRDLGEWLAQFVKQFSQLHAQECMIELQLPEEPLWVQMDFSQLEQVLSNLCSNGLRYSSAKIGSPLINLHAYLHPRLDIPCLDVIDYGEGVSDSDRERIFEPFFTTASSSGGTGLGLYIARELCLANQAGLDYKRTAEGHSCFQISFPHVNKLMN